MIDVVKKLGPSGGLGVLAGLAMMWWVEPETTAGRVLLVAICIVVFGLVGGALAYWLGNSKAPEKNSEADDKPG